MSDSEQVEGKDPIVKRRAQLPRRLVDQIKTEYLKGLGSIRELSEKYNVSPNAVSARCLRESWRVESNQVVEKVIETVEKVESSRLKLLRSHEDRMILRMNSRLDLVDKTYSQIGELVEPQDLKSLVGTEAQIDQVIRRNLGANDSKIELGGSLNVNIVATLEKVWGEVEKGKGRVWDVEAVKLASQTLEDQLRSITVTVCYGLDRFSVTVYCYGLMSRAEYMREYRKRNCAKLREIERERSKARRCNKKSEELTNEAAQVIKQIIEAPKLQRCMVSFCKAAGFACDIQGSTVYLCKEHLKEQTK